MLKKHLDKLLYNFTSRGFQGFLIASLIFCYATLRLWKISDIAMVTAFNPAYSTVITAWIASLGLFLGKTGWEEYVKSKFNNK